MSLPPVLTSQAGKQLLKELAAEFMLNEQDLLDLLRAADEQSGKLRRKGLFQSFDRVLDPSGQ